MPFAGYKDFGACVAAQTRKGKSPLSARKICGALQAKAEGKGGAASSGGAKNASQIPQEVKPHYNRSVKTLDFLKQQGVLAEDEQVESFGQEEELEQNDTSLDNQQSKNTMSFYSDPESYSDKVTRIMDEYNISETEAKEIVGEIIQNEMKEIDRREYEVLKQVQMEKIQADGGMMTEQDGKEPQPEQQQQEENVNQSESPPTAATD